jgi:hypothetical protein
MYELQARGTTIAEEAREVVRLPDQVPVAIRGLMANECTGAPCVRPQ